MDRKHDNEKTSEIEQTPKTLTVEDLASVVGGALLASEAKGPLGIGEVRYAVPTGGGPLSGISTFKL
jgi:hypothetical protein